MSDDDKITFPVEASHIMMFSRSIGDFSADYDANAAAPPTYAQSVAQFNPDYFLRMKDDEPWFGSGKNPSGIEGKPASSGGLHAEQHFEYERPIRPGDVLTVTTRDGNTWSVRANAPAS